jgi:hypothetical protein
MNLADTSYFDDEPAGTSAPAIDELRPFGLGWRWRWRVGSDKVEVTFRGMRQGASGPNGQITVRAVSPTVGVKGTLTVERLTLSDGRARASLANRLTERTGEQNIQWRDLLDGVCSRILTAAQAGPPKRTIGLEPERGTNWLIQGLVEEHQTTSIYGDGEVGKSWQALAACVSLKAGIEIVPGWVPARRGNGLYIDYETDQETLNRRVRMICRGAGIPYVPISYVACDGPLSEQVEWLLERIEAAMAGTRGDGDVNEPAAKVNQVLRKIGRSAVLVDHINAIGAASRGLAGKAYGSIFKRNWVRMSYEVKRVHESADGQRHLGVYCTKRNNGPRFDAFGLAWHIDDETTSWRREDISEPDLTAALSVKKRIEIALREESPLSITSLVERCEASISNVRTELSRDKGRTLRRLPNDLWELADPSRPHLEVVNAALEDVPELPGWEDE